MSQIKDEIAKKLKSYKSYMIALNSAFAYKTNHWMTFNSSKILSEEEQKKYDENKILYSHGYVTDHVTGLVESEINEMTEEELVVFIDESKKIRSFGPLNEYYSYCRSVLVKMGLIM